MKDYSTPRTKKLENIQFRIDDDVFEAHPRVGAGIIDDMMDLTEFGDLLDIEPKNATRDDMIRLMKANHNYNLRLMQFLDTVLLPESAQRYAQRLRSATEPIDRPQSQQVVKDLIEAYSKPHPTEPPSSSTNGRGGTDENSTAGVPAKE